MEGTASAKERRDELGVWEEGLRGQCGWSRVRGAVQRGRLAGLGKGQDATEGH